MKENKGMNTKVINLKEYSYDEVGLLLQVILIELLLIFAIVNMISKAFEPAFYSILTMIMFVMAYNNKKIYKKKHMTLIYTVVGLFVLISTLVEYVF